MAIPMLLFAADENLNYNIVRGLLRRKTDMNIVRIQDVGLSGKDDVTVLEWAAQENRILLTHDVTTITKYAYDRINEGLPMPGVFEINMNSPLGDIIDDILLLSDEPSDTLMASGSFTELPFTVPLI